MNGVPSRADLSVFDLVAALKLEPELRRWRRDGLRPKIWWRDDDARHPTPALDRLLSAAAGRPLALAVIPNPQLDLLAARLALASNVQVGQHGVDHVNKSQPGAEPSEYAPTAGAGEIAQAIAAARTGFVEAGLAPHFFTPPWNACQPGLDAALSACGFDRLSAGPHQPADAQLSYAPSDVDLLRWRGGPRFRGSSRIAAALANALRWRRRAGAWGEPVGLLTHHLVHDEPTWRFLDWLTRFADRHFDWVGLNEPAPLTAT